MKHMVGKNWRDLFDMVIVQADKPNFFTDRRKYVPQCNTAVLCVFYAPLSAVHSFSYPPEEQFIVFCV